MPTFQAKPRTITANRFHADKAHDPPGVCRGGKECYYRPHLTAPHVHTMHGGGPVLLKDGDWIVPEPDGQGYYPIDAAVMQTNYERLLSCGHPTSMRNSRGQHWCSAFPNGITEEDTDGQENF